MMQLNQRPNWRWVRARELVDKRLSPRRSRDDKFVAQAYKYLQRYRKDNPRVEEQVASAYPTIHKAKELYEDIYSGTRWVHEAGVMAGQSLEFMAEYLNTAIEVLEVYEALFFDVRDALEHKGCILSNVLMPLFKGGARAKDPDFAWKLVAYEGGWDAVRSIWEIGDVAPAAIDFLNRTFKEQVLRTAREAVYSIEPNGFNSVELITKGLDLIKFEHEAGAVATRDQSQASIGALLDSISLRVERTRAKLPTEEPRQTLIDASTVFELAEPAKIEVDAEVVEPDEEKK
jgi:hypothetical protein